MAAAPQTVALPFPQSPPTVVGKPDVTNIDIPDNIWDIWNEPVRMLQRAQQLHNEHQDELARVCFEQSLNLLPNDVICILQAAQFYYSTEATQRSMELVDSGLALAAQMFEHPINIGINLPNANTAGNHQANAANPGAQITAAFCWMKARILFSRKHFEDTIAILSYCLSVRHGCSDITYNWRASSYCELKQYQLAIEDYNEAIKQTREPASYYNSRGTCYHELGNHNEALNDYNRAIKADPRCVSAWNNRASLWVDLKEFTKALNDANHGLTMQKTHGNLHKHRAMAMWHLKRYNEAIDDVNTAIKYEPTYRPARIALKFIWGNYFHWLCDGVEYAIVGHNDFLFSASTGNLGHLYGISPDVLAIITDFAVGNDYDCTENMVDATYTSWKSAQQDESQNNASTNTNAQQQPTNANTNTNNQNTNTNTAQTDNTGVEPPPNPIDAPALDSDGDTEMDETQAPNTTNNENRRNSCVIQ